MSKNVMEEKKAKVDRLANGREKIRKRQGMEIEEKDGRNKAMENNGDRKTSKGTGDVKIKEPINSLNRDVNDRY